MRRPILETPEHVLDFMALFVLCFAKRCRGFAALARRDAGRDPLGFQSSTVFIRIVTLVCNHCCAASLLENRIQDLGSNMIRDLSCGQTHRHRSPLTIAHGMQFGVQSTFRAANVVGKKPPFTKLDAVRCAFKWVASIIRVSGGPSAADK